MNISLIGSGNVATVLGRLLKKNGHVIVEIAGRNHSHAAALAMELCASVCDAPQHINQESDMYIIAVSDDAVSAVSSALSLNEKIVVHTSGSVSADVLNHASKNVGVLYPLQSLRKDTNYFPSIPFLIDGNNKTTLETIRDIAGTISRNVTEANDGMRLHYHLSAVAVSNFTNHLFALTKQYAVSNNIEFNLLLPLIEEIVNRLHHYEPAAMQTGPAARGDETTIKKHLALLEKFPQLKHIYEAMSQSIQDFDK